MTSIVTGTRASNGSGSGAGAGSGSRAGAGSVSGAGTGSGSGAGTGSGLWSGTRADWVAGPGAVVVWPAWQSRSAAVLVRPEERTALLSPSLPNTTHTLGAQSDIPGSSTTMQYAGIRTWSGCRGRSESVNFPPRAGRDT